MSFRERGPKRARGGHFGVLSLRSPAKPAENSEAESEENTQRLLMRFQENILIAKAKFG
jgi:hypothetical protein